MSDNESGSTSGSDDEFWVPYSERPEYQDLEPVPQDDGPNPPVAIQYTPRFTETMNHFRAVLQANERSKRALHLTGAAIRLNPANYTAWYYRRQCLKELDDNELYRRELDLVDEMANINPKNYQLWHHRQAVVDRLQDASLELSFINEQFAWDAKNYHAWSYRQWVVEAFNLGYDKELEYTKEQLLMEDFRNNSAWNQRHWALCKLHKVSNTADLNDAARTEEIEYVIHSLKQALDNQSAWNYLEGFYRDSPDKLTHIVDLVEQVSRDHPDNVHALAFLAEHCGKNDLYQRLIELDPIRARYWAFRAGATA